MNKAVLSFIMSAFAFLGVQGALVEIGGTWSSDLSSPSYTVSNIAATSGTNAAVAFDLSNTSSLTTVAGGVYNTFGSKTLGSTIGDSITLQFTISFTTNTGSAVNLDRRLVFGLAGSDDKVFAMVDTGTAAGDKLRFGEAINDSTAVALRYLYQAGSASVGTGFSGNFFFGADAADTTYTMTLTRIADGAELNLSQAKTGNDWMATTRTYTTEQANALSFDKVFIGLNATQGDFEYTVTDLTLNVIPEPATIGLVGAAAAVLLIFRRMRRD